MGFDTTVQFRTDSSIKEGAFAVFKEMGISPSAAMQLFLQQVHKTRTLPFIVTANHGPVTVAEEEKEEGYDEWLRARLDKTIRALDSGNMKSYPHDEAMQILDARLEARRKAHLAHNQE